MLWPTDMTTLLIKASRTTRKMTNKFPTVILSTNVDEQASGPGISYVNLGQCIRKDNFYKRTRLELGVDVIVVHAQRHHFDFKFDG